MNALVDTLGPPKPDAQPEETAASATPNEVIRARILVVDDQPANLQIVGSILGNLGHEIVPALDGPTALKRMAARLPDLILLDLILPGMDGCEVCRRLKANPEWSDVPIIFLSAADDKDLIVRALDAGGVDYITKPFNHAELISRVRTQLALKVARDRLRQIAEDKDELIGILTHDLKNSLGGMSMSAELLCDRVARLNDERLVKLADNIRRTSVQSLTYLKEYLANAAADHVFVPKPAVVSLADAAAAVVRQYQEMARRKELEIRTELPPGDSTVRADASALGQVLDNLLSNAVKFSPPGKRIFVSVRPAPGHVESAIRDEGPGFTAEDRTRMFRRYGRLSARPTGGEPSTGLGLSIVRKLVLAMDGEVICESSPGQGATFTIRLPRASSEGL
ncbi:MAG: hybrid sensor histidine kinase/response regulator [Verrucomicrobiota bacterium]|nr:hybrid sensor histidine kinase/response regulator [Verrucomicrobiota bacterium]